MCASYMTRSGRVVRPPAVPRMPLPPDETDDEEVDPTFDPSWVSDSDDSPSSSSSSFSVCDEDDDDACSDAASEAASMDTSE